ncbi:MAG: hypothetical protein OEV43_01265 [Coriobacteriia bacterium]|nr:hypothetical protein [Coriobacteriia bacterium]
MRNVRVRTKILLTVLIVNLLGAVAIVVYLHQSYSSGLDLSAEGAQSEALGAWEQLGGPDLTLGPVSDPAEVETVLANMKEVTGADYGYLLDKGALEPEAYSEMRENAGLPNNWDEREAYALVASTDEAAEEHMLFSVDPGSVPEVGKIVGIENGACSKMCHESMTGEGDYWAVKWSTDSASRAHAVVPVVDGMGDPIGVVYAIEDISARADAARTSLLRTLVVIGVTLIVATLIIGGLIDVLVFRRLERATASIQDLSVRFAGGDFDVHFEPDGTGDEIGQFEQFFADLMSTISVTLKSLSSAKKND